MTPPSAYLIGYIVGLASGYALAKSIEQHNKNKQKDWCACGEELIDGRCPLEPAAMGDDYE